MNGRDPPSDSFDPRSWGGGASTPTAAPRKPDEATSFDPSTWAKAAPEGAIPPVAPVHAPAAPSRRSPEILAAIVAAAMLAGGAGLAFLTRGPAATPTVAAADAPKPPPPPGSSTRTVTLAAADLIPASLADMGIDAAVAKDVAAQLLAALGTAPGEVRLVAQLAPGADGRESLVSIEATRSDGSGAIVNGAAGSWTAQKLDARLEKKIVSARGEMDNNSFYTSAVTAGIADSVIGDFASAFSFDVDFQRDIKPGDIFEAAFEQAYNPAGEAVGSPRLLFASLRLETKSLRLYKFTAPGEAEDGWFDANGRSNVRSMMRTPIEGARVTSQFGFRIHPVQGFRKMHRGTDFGAPTGTSVYASSNGQVVGAGPDRCAGNLIKIQQDNGWLTKYFHLSKFADGIAVGSRVTQGQVVGAVGNTGTCTTGPHLHFEVWIDNEPVNSRTVDTGTGKTLEGGALDAFKRERDRIDQARTEQAQ